MKGRAFFTLAIAWTLTLASHAEPRLDAEAQQVASILAPTNHPILPADLSRLWLVPAKTRAGSASGSTDFLAAMKVADKTDYAKALPLFTKASRAESPFGNYALYYAGMGELRLGRFAAARDLFQQLLERRPIGYLAEAAALGAAECAEGLNDYDAAVAIYERLAAAKTTAPDELLMRLGGAAKSAGDNRKAAEAFGRVLYDFPLSSSAPLAQSQYAALPNVQPLTVGSQRYKLELGRAERLFGARRYADARKVYEALQPLAAGDDREIVDLRLAESDYYQKRVRVARDALKPYTTKGSRQGEALFFYALASGDLGEQDEFRRAVRRIVDEFPTESWAEEALNNQATRHVVADEDDEADAVFRELYEKYPRGSYAERAAWKAGWRAYRQERPADTVRFFERAAAEFPRSDYRPAWLYWAGRAHDLLKEPALADERYMLTAADYMNSYYGRLALKRLEGRKPPPRILGEPTLGTAAASERAGHPGAALGRSVRRSAQRAPVRAAGMGRCPGGPGDHFLRVPPERHGRIEHDRAVQSAARLDHAHAPRVSAVHGGRRAGTAARHPGSHLPDGVLGSHQQVLSPEQPRSVPDRCADGAGVDVRAGHPFPRQRIWAAAALAFDRAADGAQAEDPVLDAPADEPRGQRPHGDRPFRRLDPRFRRRRPPGACQLQRRRIGRAPVDQRASGSGGPRGVHRRHSVPGDSELREADPRHRGRLPPPVRRQLMAMSKLVGSSKATQFTESVIREMTRLNQQYGGVNLSQGFPDFGAPEAVKEAAVAAIRADVNQYAVTWGTRAFREAIARQFTTWYGPPVDADQQVTVTCGATEAMMATMLAIIDPGDEVVVFEPFYENYGPDAILSGATPRYVTLRPRLARGRR